MGGCCGKAADTDPNDTCKAGGQNDFSNGPVKNRGCTDIPCLIVYFAFWALFIIVTFAGFSDGNPAKLYRPRDFRGEYCGVEENWNNGLNLKDQLQRTYTMNTTETVDLIAKQLVCSSVSATTLNSILTAEQLATYRCACCLDACASCTGSLPIGDLSTSSAVSTTISGKMTELNGNGESTKLFSTDSFNGNFISNVWKEATKYFVAVCLPKCDTPYTAIAGTDRSYVYSPSPDAPWKTGWDALATNSGVPADIRSTISTSFTFKALPLSVCPYEAQYCVPFPGTTFKELSADYCTFEIAADVVNSIGADAATAYQELGATDVVNGATDSLGDAVGDFMRTLDAFVVVCFLSLVIGLIFLVLLRFVVGCIVWFSIGAVFCFFLLAGGMFYVRSSQCNGAGLFDSGKNMGEATLVASSSAVSGNGKSEAMTGNGKDYRGGQSHTKSGKSCQAWTAQSPHQHSQTAAIIADEGLEANYCRNPETAPGIWCYTTDPAVRWEMCEPIGVIRPGCPQGYVVASETFRKILEVMAYIIWIIAFLWIVAVCCLCKQIRLAIGINKVAAMFVYNTPSILLVPILQIFIGIAWFFIWALCASFLLSQVPEDYIPTTAFTSYAVAYGTEDNPGKCTDKASAGFAWKYAGNPLSTNDPCSGNLGDTTGIVPACWKCAPPRYTVASIGFGISLFSYLWNAAFLIAVGQCTIAGACAVWFFAAHEQKRSVSAVRTGVYNCFRYHTGSLAVGSFILALVQFIRYFCKYLEQQAKAQKNKAMVIVMKILQYCLWCIEKCIKFLNKNAYIQIAILGKNFCTSAKNAFFLWSRNFARFGVVATLGSIIHALGFIFITTATALLGYFILKAMHEDVTPVFPVLAYIAIAYLVSNLYMNVFGLAVDTILHCFIATEEMGGNNDAFVPKPLMSFLDSCGANGDDSPKGAWGS